MYSSPTSFKNKKVTVFSYYHPPGQDPLPADFLRYIAHIPYSILLGDFNARHTQFGDVHTNVNGRILSDCLIELNLWRCYNNKPTFINHNGISIPDHIILTPDLINHFDDQCFIGQTVTSDHLPLLIHSDLSSPPDPLPETITFRNIKNADWELFRDSISRSLPINPPLQNIEDLSHAIERFSGTITEAFQTAAPERTINLNRPPLPPFIVNLIKEKRRIYRHFLRTRDAAIKTEYNRLSATIRRETNRFMEEKWAETTAKLDFRDGKKFWRQFRILTNSNRTQASHLKIGNTYVTAPLEKANIFKNHLQNIFQIPQNANFDDILFHDLENNFENIKNYEINFEMNGDGILNAPISAEIVAEAISAGRNTAPGDDGINRAILRQIPPECHEYLGKIFNRCMELCYFPREWKEATTILIPKPHKDLSHPDNYRPISLLNVVGKVFEKIICRRLSDFVDHNNIIPDFQHGFRPFHSTIDPLLRLHTDITRALNSGECVLATFLDIKRAFDQVWHAGLVRKLQDIQLPNHFVKLIASYLSDRTIKIKVNKSFSDPFTPSAGIPQGSILAPLLYIIYTYDIPHSRNRRSKVSLFADDTATWATARTSALCNRIAQSQLDEIGAWARKWRLTPNPGKPNQFYFTIPIIQLLATFPKVPLVLDFGVNNSNFKTKSPTWV
ncbi:hypothetical protein WA026_021344 [Henosepilachna vigintioctopunctata]|uniref:Reverse transcriptase domain-containing protein n=1 Tax=Henosepilachna vigintioctopunctata TaxID=420089 RepID=A0AAW1U5T5_9CUCU